MRVVAAGVLVHLLVVASNRRALWRPVCWCIARCGKLPVRVVAAGVLVVALCGKRSRGARCGSRPAACFSSVALLAHVLLIVANVVLRIVAISRCSLWRPLLVRCSLWQATGARVAPVC